MKPILFSTPMVRAILDGRKTMTRRAINPQPVGEVKFNLNEGGVPRILTYNQSLVSRFWRGDILWVRETWTEAIGVSKKYYFKAHIGEQDDVQKCVMSVNKWRPSIFMPREAARIFLRVTDVRAERLRDITAEDVQREGLDAEFPGEDVKAIYPEGSDEMIGVQNWCKEYSQFIFRNLWYSINAKRGYGWDTNPWVWVYSFGRCEKPEGCKWPE